ncbi:MAG: Hsp20/alpha crystallin family protein [Cyanobium sp.]
MQTLRQSPFEMFGVDLFNQLEQQLHSAQNQCSKVEATEQAPSGAVHETPDAFLITLDLPGVDKTSIDIKATDRTVLVNAERHQPEQAALVSEISYGTLSRRFRFPSGINREAITAQYRDGVLTVTAAKAQTMTKVEVQIEA